MDQLTKNVRYSKWAEIITAANASGLSKTEYCRRNGISDKTFFYYQKKIRETLYNSSIEGNVPFVEVPMTGNRMISSDRAAVIHLGDITIEISDGISESTLMSIGRMIRNAL